MVMCVCSQAFLIEQWCNGHLSWAVLVHPQHLVGLVLRNLGHVFANLGEPTGTPGTHQQSLEALGGGGWYM